MRSRDFAQYLYRDNIQQPNIDNTYGMKGHELNKPAKRPPTRRMIERLKYALEKEKTENAPCLADEMKSSLAGLYKRGFVETRMQVVNDKKILCIYITESGKQFLKTLEDTNFPEPNKN